MFAPRFSRAGALRLCSILVIATAVAILAWTMSAKGSGAVKPPTIAISPHAALPDLAEKVPTHLAVVTFGAGKRRSYALAFQAVAENLTTNGDAEMFIVGHRPSTRVPFMTADQYINIKDAHTGAVVSQQVIHNVGRLIYQDKLVGHDHWHLQDFETYTLERASSHKVIARDPKIGFCLANDVPVGAAAHSADTTQNLRARAARKLITYKDDTPGCGIHRPRLTRVIESLNPDNGDVYERTLGGQNVPVTNVPNGKYILVIRVNPADRYVEANYNDDYASVLVSIHRPHPHAKPTFKLLRRCPGRATCP